ncbi:MAG: DUF3631 domain-containing protein [Gemmatimonadota bacterium]
MQRVPYRWDDVRAMTAAGSTAVFYAEGEKGANALHAIGAAATTFGTGAAGSPPPNAAEFFTGVAGIVILPDNDDAGRDHAARVAALFHAGGLAVKILELPGLPKGGDAYDWLASGGNSSALRDLVKAAPRYTKPAHGDASSHVSQALPVASADTPPRHSPPIIPPPRQSVAAADADSALDPWPEPVAAEPLLESLARKLQEYVVLGTHQLWAIVLWIVHTWCLEAADVTPYLWVHSATRECGKTTLLDLLAQLAFRAERADGITAAALYRRIDRLAPTMLLDELDVQLKMESGEALRGVLNSGYTRSGSYVVCVARGKVYEEQKFKTFCPKVLAGIGRLWDTVVSRSIPIRLERATNVQKAALRRMRLDRIAAECEPLRRQMMRWAVDHVTALRDSDPFVPSQLGSRQADVWRPLLGIADAAGEPFPKIAQAASLGLQGLSGEDGDWGILLLEDLRSLAYSSSTSVTPSQNGKHKSGLATRAILEHLHNLDERPWPEYSRGRPIKERGLASLLGRFSMKSQTIRLGADVTAKGYPLDGLMSAFERYLPPRECDVVTAGQEVLGNASTNGHHA